MSDYPVNPFVTGESSTFPEHLNQEFATLGDAINTLSDEFATGNEALHGTGAESTGTLLEIATGRACDVSAGAYWINGRRYVMAADVTVALPANQTSHLYMDAVGTVSVYATLQGTNPVGTWYIGTATTNSAACTAVDDSDADRVANLAQLPEITDRLTIAEADIDALDGRVTDIESGAVGGSGPAYWGALGKASSDATTITQAIEAGIDAHEADKHSGEVDTGDDNGTTVIIMPQDVDAVNQARHLLKYTRTVDPDGAADQVDAVTIVWGVWGDGTGGSPDFVDRVNSTWLPA